MGFWGVDICLFPSCSGYQDSMKHQKNLGDGSPFTRCCLEDVFFRCFCPPCKLTASLHLNIGLNDPKGKDRFPTTIFQGRTVSFRECIPVDEWWQESHFRSCKSGYCIPKRSIIFIVFGTPSVYLYINDGEIIPTLQITPPLRCCFTKNFFASPLRTNRFTFAPENLINGCTKTNPLGDSHPYCRNWTCFTTSFIQEVPNRTHWTDS